MSVKKDPSGRRSIQVEVEVPGTPEQVWKAIATGPGISSWFCPTRLEERVGGTVAHSMGPGMESAAKVTAWEPPRRLAAEDATWNPKAPPLATEWIVEARGGGKCIVRVVHSLFASTDEWNDQLESFEGGWPVYFQVLRFYLAHHFGQPCSTIQAMSFASGSDSEAWTTLTKSLGLTDAKPGQTWRAPPTGAPALAGTVEPSRLPKFGHTLALRLEEPAPGIGLFGAYPCNGAVFATANFFLYGDRAAAAAKRDEPRWQAWFSERFQAST